MTRRQFSSLLGGAALAHAAPAPRPNLVFILADDLGWRDTSLYGSTFYETPNIEALARRGMMFTDAYAAAPICSPTRASILTGLYPARIGITTPSCHLPQVVLEQTLGKGQPTHKALQANSITRLKQEYVTLAEVLHDAGYRTGHFGKWHLGMEPYDPLHQGFDVDVPHWHGPGPAGSYLAPWKFPKFTGEPGEHIEDRMSREAVRFIRENKDRPFYLNYWAFSVHSPWNAKADLIKKYQAKADPANGQRNAVAGAMVESLDQAVGTLMRALDETGVADRTIVVFFSDNGGVFWQPGKPGMQHPEWENVPITSNAPLRGGKATLYEGGTREPCIVVWPGVTKPGSKSGHVISSVDFFPTVLEMTGARPNAKLTFDGVSFAAALRGKPSRRAPNFCHFPHYTPATGGKPGTWVRSGDWKLIRFWCDGENQKDRFELYNLKDDIGEKNDLSASEAARVRELNGLIENFLRETKAIIPKPNPAYRADAG